MRSYIDQRFDCVTSFCGQIDEKISSVVEWMKNSNPSTTPYTYHSPLHSGFMNTGEACDVNEDPLVHVEVQNDENQDDNEEREVEDYVLANEPVIVKEATLPAYGNEQKQADDMNNCPNLIEVENEQRQATDLPNDDETRVEERDTCVPMDSIAHGDVMESIPIVVEDESDKSSQIGHEMRIKKRSLVLESPFTNPEKKRKLHNVNAFDPFQELDPAKADDLQNWLVNAPDRFINTGEACDVNEDPLVHVEVQNDENQDDNEEREVEDYVLANEPVIVKEATLPAYGNEQKQADDMNNYPNPIEVENEQRQATDLPSDDETRVEERDTCVPMDSIAHGDVIESIPIVVEDESDKSSQIGRGMRIKKRSLVLESPFTNPEKRRKLRNANKSH
ncbi:Hypothetical predicted protein [Olea europaea subsp. europaea]|uniref:Uncharacterized protein n=1 Tax=Olea europaea subsp. europaea TaxID=158383 RepID=A0A8S0R5T9_OLEEU|nr:Hypothetical predicted protein [Olea europaea subsp. europaea]